MPGKRLTVSEHGAIVIAVRRNDVALARRLAEGYLFFVDTDEEAAWLDGVMRRDGLSDTPPQAKLPPVVLPIDGAHND